MASATSRSARCCASGEAAANWRVGTSLIPSRIAPGSQWLNSEDNNQTAVPAGGKLFFRGNILLREIGRVAHDGKQLLNFTAVRDKEPFICGVDAAKTLFQGRRRVIGGRRPAFT